MPDPPAVRSPEEHAQTMEQLREQRRKRRPLWLAVGGLLGLLAGAIFVSQGNTPIAPSRNPSLEAPAAAPHTPVAPGVRRPAFDRARSWQDLIKQVEFGPRVPNLPGHTACRDWMVETLKPLADSVERQDFSRTLDGTTLRMSNVIARWKGSGAGKNGVLLCAHWDTRPTADYEFDPKNRRMPIPGANDGASGVAVLMELARAFKQQPPPVPVMIVMFDGEDFGPGVDRMFLGSRHFAANLPRETPRRGVLLDMVGDKDLLIPMEGYSARRARDVLDEVYETAHRRGHGRHFPKVLGGDIEDDHVQLHARGLRVIDLIDFDYGPGHGWWHTLGDTPDKCSADSLFVVGDTVTEWVYSRS